MICRKEYFTQKLTYLIHQLYWTIIFCSQDRCRLTNINERSRLSHIWIVIINDYLYVTFTVFFFFRWEWKRHEKRLGDDGNNKNWGDVVNSVVVQNANRRHVVLGTTLSSFILFFLSQNPNHRQWTEENRAMTLVETTPKINQYLPWFPGFPRRKKKANRSCHRDRCLQVPSEEKKSQPNVTDSGIAIPCHHNQEHHRNMSHEIPLLSSSSS